MNDGAFDSGFNAVFQHAGNKTGGDLNKDRIHRFGEIFNSGVAEVTGDFVSFRVHRIEFSGESVLQHIFYGSSGEF